ncbi:MAG: efflux RND transporter periplasmic adaptor subunit [Gammaproteobacteria bacterium]|nr:efflux RND transporter periplasmic adaptor subunit [Gammaproteobacteria bacterium]
MMMVTRQRLPWIAGAALSVLALIWLALRPEPVVVVTPERRDVVEVVVASGKLRAVRQGMVGAEAPGVVESVEVTEGDLVQAGQLLGRVRLGETDARLAGALASLRAAQTDLRGEESQLDNDVRELRRASELADRKLVPVAELDAAEAAERVQRARTDASRARLEEARAEVDKIRPEFGKREVRAPFDGVVIERMVEPGTTVSATTAWFTVAEMSATEIYVETDENNLGRLAVGQPAIAVAPAYPENPFNARLVQVGPNVDSDRGVVGLRLRSENLPDFVLPNMTVDVNIEVRRTTGGLALPARAVLFDGTPRVLALIDGRVAPQPVSVLGRNPEWVAVDGLAADTEVLREARRGRPGQRARAIAGTEAAGRP